MKQLVILSGKGGTGKTFITSQLIRQFSNVVAVDADVDAANLNIVLNSEQKIKELFYAGNEAFIDQEHCNACGKCIEQCSFDAIKRKNGKVFINHLICEGCGLCESICPKNAITLQLKACGCWYQSKMKSGSVLFHAELFPGQDNSGKLVTALRQQAEKYAVQTGTELAIIDGPPGIACPAMAALTNTDYALFVTEPAASAIRDLERLIELSASFNVQKAVIINKSGLNSKKEAEIRSLCEKNDIPVCAKIPFSETVQLSLCRPGEKMLSAEVAQSLDNAVKSVKELFEIL
jgi:MinD superfamily P-loop ATPase